MPTKWCVGFIYIPPDTATDARLWLLVGADLLGVLFRFVEAYACGESDVGQGGSPQPRVRHK